MATIFDSVRPPFAMGPGRAGYNSMVEGSGLPEEEPSKPKYPGLMGPMPATFTKDQRARTLASLLKNETNYLQIDDRQRKPFEIDHRAPVKGKGGKVLGDGDSLYGESMYTGGGQTFAESRRERESIARQIAVAQEREQGIMADQARELARDKMIAEQAYAADEAARKQAFYEKYGFDWSPQAGAEIVKFQAKSGIQEGVAIDLAQADDDEKADLEALRAYEDQADLAAGIVRDPAVARPETTRETAIKKKYETKRNLRLQMLRYIMDASANRNEGAPSYPGTTG